MTRPSFIYSITNLKTGMKYIGSTVDIEDRWYTHKYRLTRNKHHCRHLQFSWNKHGETTFEFTVLQKLPNNDPKTRFEAEAAEIAKYKCFNSMVPNSDRNRFEHDDYTKAKIAKSGAISQTKAHRKAMSARAKKLWSDPETRAIMLDREFSPETLASKSKKMKEWHASIEGKAKSIRQKKWLAEQWANPDSSMRKQDFNGRWQDPEFQKKQSAGMKAGWANPEKRASWVAGSKSVWDRPGERERRCRIMREYFAKKRAAKLNQSPSS